MIVQPKNKLSRKIFPLFLVCLEYAIFVGIKKIKKKTMPKSITNKKSILVFLTQRPSQRHHPKDKCPA